jgi:hypothetical protein
MKGGGRDGRAEVVAHLTIRMIIMGIGTLGGHSASLRSCILETRKAISAYFAKSKGARMQLRPASYPAFRANSRHASW